MKVTATKETPVCRYCNTAIRLTVLSDGTRYWNHCSAGSNGGPGCTVYNLIEAGQIPEFKAAPTIVYYKKEVDENGE